MAFQFTIERAGKAAPMVRLTGRLALGPQLLEFGRRMADLLRSHEGPGILLEISGVEDIDSAGLGELVILYTAAGQLGRRVCLVRPAQRVVQLLKTTRLTGILPHFEDELSARSWIRASMA